MNSSFHPDFQKTFSKIKDEGLKEKLIKQFIKIMDDPDTGKPMRFSRKGTREVYVPPFRLSYIYLKEEDKIVFLDLFYKVDQ